MPRSRSSHVGPLPRAVATALAVVLLAGCSSSSSSEATVAGPHLGTRTSPSHQRAHSQHHTSPAPSHHPQHPVVAAVDLPDHVLTPGVALPVTAAEVCLPGYASSVRDVSDSEKAAVYARYGIQWVPYQHEVDHLISLELGGSNAIRNLWPEPYSGRWGARTKDALENRLHDRVCSGVLSLRAAQHQEAANWVAAYRRYMGTPPSGGGGGSTTAPGGFYASSYPTASTIYCADDLEWRNLSPHYLVHFATVAQALARFPDYHLHQLC